MEQNEFSPTRIHCAAKVVVRGLVSLLVRLKVEPNYITSFGVLCALAAGVFLSDGRWLGALVCIALGGLLDIIDGEVARRMALRSQHMQNFGQFLDPASDRLSDIFLLLGLIAYVHPRYATEFVVLIAGTLAAHLTSSWLRAKVESLGSRFHKKKPLTRATLLTALITICFTMLVIPDDLRHFYFFWLILLLICLPKIGTFIAWFLRAYFIIVKGKHIGRFS
ncbi:MAG: CDP-alcohol phosphatidyltransferase family protein [Patescibacteria group bacterium]